MRKIGSFSTKAEADKFRLLLQGYNISCYEEAEEPEARDIWILSEDEVGKAKIIYDKFKENSDSLEFSQIIAKGRKSHQQEKKERKVKTRQVVTRDTIFTSFPITITLIGASSLIFLLASMGYLGGGNQLKILVFKLLRFSLYSGREFYEIREGQIWRLVTPIFLHGDIFHIFFNMMWLWILGQQVEGHESPRKLVALVFVIAIPSHVVFYLVAGPFFGGMSGVNYGLFTYIWFMDRYAGHPSYRIDANLSQFFFVWYILCLVLTFFGMRIANSIHGVGALMGLLFAFLTTGKFKQTKKLLQFNRSFRKQTAIGIGLLLAGLLVDYLSYYRAFF